MSDLSVLTLARNRTPHLLNLLEGLRRSDRRPHELVVVDMNDSALALPPAPFPVRVARLPDRTLPLAGARNRAARLATGCRLLFLDADCIPSAGLVDAIETALDETDALICPEALYLGPDDARGPWTEGALRAAGRAHPVRPFPAEGLRPELNPGLFWSLAFGVRRATFEALGGFDETFVGYGGEDTDFGLTAQAAGTPLLFLGGAPAFHQHHPVSDPPIEHLADIVRNAELFHAKWRRWPMEGWLAAFEAMGLVARQGDRIVARPSAAG
ncbi:GT2 family glycosyltransferase [Methylopila capsulata]|uniref:GT2 family glycosyltransferase n=1 Tax=Methylopila capsulata TaxID=61654 RepID=A0A9W6IS19_9HYPH|nr:glycosyltransferase [Methylopila capsulata]MBM7851519.1 GT2 family glycosyltransferase [Methylopila capsulata]GLK54577.1 glycosyl transferase family A [Methylopila capsulata]